ncbi:DUF4386 family protein [Actinokineospora cianjurensis]|uniref:Uncharacterized protein DUF4386 n=1 Tax=Actinokineospora cianjurensis TaxID=585224 RepID=A0A421BC21_9PSEU|nr:DUF4386 family protein [Actinokineospora cianjurensis]RLK61888.1 uncharacterized protein DUF4386 [Actinokineospora cianjurensis]
MSPRTTATLVALLFLTSTASFAAADAMPGTAAGAVLLAYTGLAVAGIGIALLPILRPHSPILATAYLALRLGECLVLLAAAADLVTGPLLVYAFTGAAGLALAIVLVTSRLVPLLLAVLGVIGYLSLLVGAVLDLLNLSSLDSGPGIAFYVPGGLFELALPVLLLVRGFATPR